MLRILTPVAVVCQIILMDYRAIPSPQHVLQQRIRFFASLHKGHCILHAAYASITPRFVLHLPDFPSHSAPQPLATAADSLKDVFGNQSCLFSEAQCSSTANLTLFPQKEEEEEMQSAQPFCFREPA